MFDILVQCPITTGSGTVMVPDELVAVISTIYSLIKFGVPLLLVIFGMLDLGKAVMQQKEDDIKKGQQTFLKRLIAAAIVFFVLAIVQLLMNVIGEQSIFGQLGCILNGK